MKFTAAEAIMFLIVGFCLGYFLACWMQYINEHFDVFEYKFANFVQILKGGVQKCKDYILKMVT